MLTAYELGKEERDKRGLAGREWAMSDEAKMTSDKMTQNIIEGIDETIANFIPRPTYEVHLVEDKEIKKVEHKLTGY